MNGNENLLHITPVNLQIRLTKMVLPTISVWWFIRLFLIEEDQSILRLVTYCLMAFFGLIMNVDCFCQNFLQSSFSVLLLGNTVSALLMEINIQERDREKQYWEQSTTELLQLVNFIQISTLKKQKCLYTLPLYATVRIIVDIVFTCHLFSLEICFILAIITLFLFLNERIERQLEIRETLDTEKNINEQVISDIELGEQTKLQKQNFIPWNQSSPVGNQFLAIRSRNHTVKDEFSQVTVILRKVLNNFADGVLILDHQLNIQFMNPKCEKHLGCVGRANVLRKLKQLITTSEIVNKNNNNNNNSKELEEIIKRGLDDPQFDFIQEIVLQKPKPNLRQSISPNQNNHHSPLSQESMSFFDMRFQASIELITATDNILEKQYRMKIIRTYLPKDENDKMLLGLNDTDCLLMFVIKNVTQKKILSQVKMESEFQTKLLLSFSHELRTPLNCSNQILNVINDRVQNDPELIVLARQCLSSNLLLNFQLNDILDFAALECSKFYYKQDTISLEAFLTHIKMIYQDACNEKGIHFQINNNLKTVTICADENRLMQVIANLLNNSVKFTPHNGSIQLIFEYQMVNFCQVMKVSVVDNGVGMSQAQISRINSEFTKSESLVTVMASSDHSGKIGLGLNLCNRLVAGFTSSIENQIQVSSIPRFETSVSFYLEDSSQQNQQIKPIESVLQQDKKRQSKYGNYVQQQFPTFEAVKKQIDQFEPNDFDSFGLQEFQFAQSAYRPETYRSSPKNDSFPKRRPQSQVIEATLINRSLCAQCNHVLLVDDVPFNHLALKALLQSLGIQIDQAYDGLEAVQMVNDKLTSHCRTYQLILMDIEMPILDGFYATKKILQRLAKNQLTTNVVMCSAYDTIDNHKAAMEAGMVNILTKPIKKRSLQSILKQYLGLNI